MSKFKVIPKPNGKFVVASINESFDEMDSEASAQLACDRLNCEPSQRACEAVYGLGRWTKKERSAAA